MLQIDQTIGIFDKNLQKKKICNRPVSHSVFYAFYVITALLDQSSVRMQMKQKQKEKETIVIPKH